MSSVILAQGSSKNIKKSATFDETMEENPSSRQKGLPTLKMKDGTRAGKGQQLAITGQSEYLPEEILFALTQPPVVPDKLGPPTRYRNLNMNSGPGRKAPANVWNHPRKDKFKHLTDQIPCFCGAGKDISFLYDIPSKQEEILKRADSTDKSRVRDEREPPKPATLPTSLVPDEYHIVKSKGVIGLEYYKDEFSTKIEDHERHLVTFPSMKPTSRYEVMQLKEVMDDLLKRAGVDSDVDDMSGASQMHNLISLIKAEQKVYNLVFHELIRQVTIECNERGQILAGVRQRYSDLLNHVPKQIMNLHEEVLAQRALDRRLTEELVRFRSQIFQLTRELTDVKEHDRLVTEQAKKAQEDLRAALEESQRNASQLGEYHELYELQRTRLETAVRELAEEKELWSTASYSLAIKVIEENGLTTTKRLHISEKSWSKLAQHFTVLLSDRDTEVLTSLQSFKEKWRDLVETFDLHLKELEDTISDDLGVIRRGLGFWVNHFKKNSLNEDGHFVKPPSLDTAKKIQTDLKSWITILQNQVDKYSGSVLLENTEALAEIEVQIKGWTEAGLEMFVRHKQDDKYPPEHGTMMELNEVHRELNKQFNLRLTGENGVARGVITLSGLFEAWDTKLTNALHGNRDVPMREWMVFFNLLSEWLENVEKVKSWVGSADSDSEKDSKFRKEPLVTHDVMKKTHQWAMSTNNAIDSTDSKLVGQVSTIHTSMVKWMVNMLLRLAPDREGTSEEALTVAHQNTPSIAALQEEAQGLFMIIDMYSINVYNCCEGIVQKRVIERMSRSELNPDSERQELIQLREESYYWIQTANLMLTQLTGEPVAYEMIDLKFHKQREKVKEPTFATTVSETVSEPTGPTGPSQQVHPPATVGEESAGLPTEDATAESAIAQQTSASSVEQRSAMAEPSDPSVVLPAATHTETETVADVSEPQTETEPQAEMSKGVSSVSDAPDVTVDGKGETAPPEKEAAQTEAEAPGADQEAPSQSQTQEKELTAEMASDQPRPPTSGLLEPPSQEKQGTSIDDDRSSAAESPAISLPTATSPTDSLKPGKREEFGQIEIIGPDENTQLSVLTQPTTSKHNVRSLSPKPPTPAVAVLNSQVSATKQPESPTIKSYEALATVDRLQNQLILTEQRAQHAEQVMQEKKLELNEALEKIRALERKVEDMEAAGAGEVLDKPANLPPPESFVAPHPPLQPPQRPPSAKSRPASAAKKGLDVHPGAEAKPQESEPTLRSTASSPRPGPTRKSVSSAGSSRGGSRPASRTSSRRKTSGAER